MGLSGKGAHSGRTRPIAPRTHRKRDCSVESLRLEGSVQPRHVGGHGSERVSAAASPARSGQTLSLMTTSPAWAAKAPRRTRHDRGDNGRSRRAEISRNTLRIQARVRACPLSASRQSSLFGGPRSGADVGTRDGCRRRKCIARDASRHLGLKVAGFLHAETGVFGAPRSRSISASRAASNPLARSMFSNSRADESRRK